MAARKKRQINLLPQEEFAASTLGRVLNWLLTTFRYIVIVTEIVVMTAFLSRFWLDAKSTDLNELIKQKHAVIAASADFEKEFRLTQDQLKILATLTSEQVGTDEILETVSSYLPPDVFLTVFSLTGEGVRVQGASPSERSIAQFIANLESSDLFDEVSLSQVGTQEENQSLLTFTLRVTLKGGK